MTGRYTYIPMVPYAFRLVTMFDTHNLGKSKRSYLKLSLYTLKTIYEQCSSIRTAPVDACDIKIPVRNIESYLSLQY